MTAIRRVFVAALGMAVVVEATACGPAATTTTSANTNANGNASGRPKASDGFGVIVMAHGGTPEWNQAVIESVKSVEAKSAAAGSPVDVEVAFGMADATSMGESVHKLEARGVRKIGVVRLFISGESWSARTEQIFGVRAGAPASSSPATPAPHGGHGGHGEHSMAFFRVKTNASFAISSEGLADVSQMGIVLADRAAALSKDPSREDVIILAHGPGDDAENARWIEKLNARADVVRKRGGAGGVAFRRVQVETLREDWPDKRVDAEKRIRVFVENAKKESGGGGGGKSGSGSAIVIPFRVQGFGPYADVLKDLEYVSDGKGLLPHPEVSSWIERQINALHTGQFQPQVP